MSIQVKICGLRTRATLQAALAAGADLVGLVHFPRSPRHVALDEARALAETARGRAGSVVLLVDPDDALIDEVAAVVRPDWLQLHGHEPLARVRDVRRRTGARLIKAISVASRADVEAAAAFHAPGDLADLILFDAKPPADPSALPGGNGLSFDWRILEATGHRFPFGLAGGLTPGNVAAAVRLVRPSLVDVSSGVEIAPGVKDEALIRAFIAAARSAGESARPGTEP
jgi:phosphoribosylanthranilate isomerase